MATAKYSFYVPHERVGCDGTLTDPVTGEIYKPPARTKQNHLAECDINNIIKQFKLTGQIAHISAKAAMGTYTDLPDPLDFQESMNLVIAAEASFATLPAKVRDRFGNDPSKFLEFMGDSSNQDEMIKLGLATPKPSFKSSTEPATEPRDAPQPSQPSGK